jgi:hypothetical protein
VNITLRYLAIGLAFSDSQLRFAQRFQFQSIFAPPLLKRAERVAHRFACILILAGLDQTFDESISTAVKPMVRVACPILSK